MWSTKPEPEPEPELELEPEPEPEPEIDDEPESETIGDPGALNILAYVAPEERDALLRKVRGEPEPEDQAHSFALPGVPRPRTPEQQPPPDLDYSWLDRLGRSPSTVRTQASLHFYGGDEEVQAAAVRIQAS
jgi:hypothetical protein